MEQTVYERMYELERSHWWFAAKRQIVLHMLRRFLQPSGPRQRVADIGCGCGMMMVDLASAGFEAVGLDANDTALEFCRARGVTVAKACLPGDLPLPVGSFDAVLLLDVLEHIPDDQAALKASLRLLRPGGIAICTVPAHPFLWTAGDELLHHVRRYTRHGFRELIASSIDCRPVLSSYMYSVLFPLAVVSRLVLKFFPHQARASHLAIPSPMLNTLLRSLSAAERHLLARRLPMPPGLSLMAVLRKISSPSAV